MSTGAESNPGEVQARRLEHVAEELTRILHQPEVAQRLSTAPGENEWSALQILGHIAEMIPYWLHDCQTIIAATEPPAFGRTLESPERLAGPERGSKGDAEALLREIKAEVQSGAKLIRGFSAEEREKTGIHLRRGEMSVANIIETFIVTHAEEHLAQIEEALYK
jgi:DinB family protein